MSKIGYIRVSSASQNQQRQLEGIELDRVFSDECSGKDTNRPQLKEMLLYIREGDILYVHSMDRLARNLDDLRQLVNDLTGQGIEIRFVKECLNFSGEQSPMAQLMLSVMGSVAEFERCLIRERQLEGIALAKKQGKYKGRKPSLNSEQKQQILKEIVRGVPISRLANDYKVSRDTIYKVKKELKNT